MVKFSKRLALILVVFLAFQLVLPGNFFGKMLEVILMKEMLLLKNN